MKIYIEVSDGLVMSVYANAPADVEVIDMDTTDPDEWNERAETLKAVENDPGFAPVW